MIATLGHLGALQLQYAEIGSLSRWKIDAHSQKVWRSAASRDR